MVCTSGEQHKPVLLVICGKSGSGKTTIVNALASTYKHSVHKVKRMTTRPMRDSEKRFLDALVDYDFTDESDDRWESCLETTTYRGWRYGTSPDEIIADKLNVIGCDIMAVTQLLRHNAEYDIHVIYLDVNFTTQLARLLHRDGIKFETFRRIVSDMITNDKYAKDLLKDDGAMFVKVDDNFGLLAKAYPMNVVSTLARTLMEGGSVCQE